jgi:glycosyltransferase involved in cell wall biosynthesis
MIAPQPFLEERGAPLAVYHHCKALLAMGFKVDLVTYHLGKPVDLPGLRVLRIPALPFIRQVRVGPSLAKIPLDILLFLLALWQLCRTRYQYVHTHEEAGLMGIVLSAIFGCRHLYYMHSDLTQQMVSSEFTHNPFLLYLVKVVQMLMIRYAHAVIAICPDIKKRVLHIAPKSRVYMIENSAVDEHLSLPASLEVDLLRQSLDLGDGPVLLYTGNLEPYQGIDLLLHSIPPVAALYPNVRYLLVGGQPEQVEQMRRLAQRLGIREQVRFTGLRPLNEMPLYMALADILLSPRSKGTNTPLKLYTYLRIGKPILATNIYSQTQVLNAETARLVSLTPESLAEGAIWLLEHPREAAELGKRAQIYAETHYSWRVFLQKCVQVQREFSGIPIALPSVPLEKERKISCAV